MTNTKSEPRFANDYYTKRLNAVIDCVEAMEGLDDRAMADALGVDFGWFTSMRRGTREYSSLVPVGLNRMTGMSVEFMFGR